MLGPFHCFGAGIAEWAGSVPTALLGVGAWDDYRRKLGVKIQAFCNPSAFLPNLCPIPADTSGYRSITVALRHIQGQVAF